MESKIKTAARHYPELALLAGLVCWIAFAFTAKLEVTDRGILSSLGVIFFIAVGLMASSVLISVWQGRAGFTAYVATFTTLFALYSLPWMISGTPFFIYSYRVLGYTNFIIDLGTYAPTSLPYQNWPGVMLVGAFLQLNTGMDTLYVLYIFPVLARTIQILAVGLLVRALTKDSRMALLAILIYGMLDWTPYYLLEPQAMGMIFLLLIIWTMAIRGTAQEIHFGYVALFIAFICTMVISHVLSTFYCLSVIFVLYVVEKRPFTKGWVARRSTLTLGLVILSIVVFLTYVLYANWYYLIRAMPGFLQSLGNLGYIFGGGTGGGDGGGGYAEVLLTKIAFLVILALVGLTAFLYAWRRLGIRGNFKIYFPLVCLVCAGAITMTVFTSYRAEAVSRLFVLTMPFLTVLCAYAWRSRAFRAGLVLLLVISPYLFVATAYGNMQMDYVSREENGGVQFFHEYSPTGAKLNTLIERIALMENIQEWKWARMTIAGDGLSTSVNNYHTYMAWSVRDIETANYNNMNINGSRLFELQNAQADNKIYSSKTYSLFQFVWW